MWKKNFFLDKLEDSEEVKSPRSVAVDQLLRICQRGDVENAERILTTNSTLFINTATFEDVALLFACSSGSEELVTYLLERGCRINVSNTHGETPLHISCLSGNTNLANKVIKEGATLYKTEAGMTCLHYACKSGDTELVKMLLQKNAFYNLIGEDLLNFASKDGETPLHVACRAGNKDVVELLLSQEGINTYAATVSGETTLMASMQRGSLAVSQILLSAQSDDQAANWINLCCKLDNDETALHLACTNLLPDQVTLLLERGGNVHVTTRDGSTPLHCACWGDFTTLGDDPKKKRRTYLSYDNTYYPRQRIMKRLIAAFKSSSRLNDYVYGGSHHRFDTWDQLGMTPAHYISRHGSRFDTELMKIFLTEGFPVDAATGESSQLIDVHPRFPFHTGTTCLHLACANGSISLARLLLKKKANPNVTTDRGWTPLHSAIHCHKSCQKAARLVALLLSHGADINSIDENGKTALHHATNSKFCEQGDYHEDIVISLLDRGARVNVQDHRGRTPLINSLHGGFDSHVIIRMLNCGADPNLKDSTGTLPMQQVLQGSYLTIDAGIIVLLLRAQSIIPHTKPKIFHRDDHFDIMNLLITGGQKRFVADSVVHAIERMENRPIVAASLYKTCKMADPLFMANQKLVLEAATDTKLDISFPSLYEIARFEVREILFKMGDKCIAPSVWQLPLPPLITNDILFDKEELLESYDGM